MCLLITGSAANITSTLLNTKGLITDIFDANPDGLGVMYKNKHGLQIRKVLPKTDAEARAFIQSLPSDDRQLALHWRWKTHGDINLDNCHPYTIQEGVSAMMHNGILKTGNAADTSRSDTWHFVQNYLKDCSPDTLHDDTFNHLLGKYIGDNRFAIMTQDGRLSVVNQKQGVSYQDVWFSNTYAWSPELLIPGYRAKYRGYSAGSSFANGYDLLEWDEEEVPFHTSGMAADKRDAAPSDLGDTIDDAMGEHDVANMEYCLQQFPEETVDHIFGKYHIAMWHKLDAASLSAKDLNLVEMWTDRQDGSIVDYIDDNYTGASKMAEALLYRCSWTEYTTPAVLGTDPDEKAADAEVDPVGDGSDGQSMQALADAFFGRSTEDEVPH